jgi:hypothetical protein
MSSSRTIAVLGVALLIVLAGCSGGMSGGDSAAPSGSERAGGGGGDAGAPAGGGAAEEPDRQQQADSVAETGADQQRLVIQTGKMTLRVESYQEARTSLTSMARDRGGYVSDSSERVHRRENTTWTTGQVVLRVPSDEFSAAFEEAKSEGEVESSSTDSEDVTDQLVDIEARLENLRTERDRLRTLYEEANETEDVLRVSRELSDVQEEIERLEARQRQLESQVQFSTITVQITEQPPEPQPRPGPDGWWETGVITAFLTSVSGVLTVIRALIVGTAYVAPYVLTFATPVFLVAALAIRRLKR